LLALVTFFTQKYLKHYVEGVIEFKKNTKTLLKLFTFTTWSWSSIHSAKMFQNVAIVSATLVCCTCYDTGHYSLPIL